MGLVGVYFSVSALIILCILSFVFFHKKRLKNTETVMYSKLLILTLFGLSLEIITCIWYKAGFSIDYYIYKFLSKLTSSYYAVWSVLFFTYLYNVCNYKESNQKKINIAILIMALIILFLPIEFVQNGDSIVPQGLSIYLTYLICLVFTVYDVYICIKYRKKIVSSKFTPLYALMTLGGLDFVLGVLYPQLFLIGYVFSLIVIIMYFTIENPDVKMISELNIAKDSAERANRAKSSFLSSMSHEIRTPLNAIVGLSEDILSRDNCPNDMKEDLEDIVSASHTLLEIVGNIMDINKIESEKMEIIEVPYNFKEEIKTLVRVNSVRIGDKPVEMKLDLAPDIPYELVGDKAHIKGIINNLLSNAIKYTDKGIIELSAKCINQDDMCNLIITCRDTGRGIKAEDINKLFNKFERLDAERNTTIEGTGLGLAITKQLVELMGGKINVESSYGEGSIFMVQIPQKVLYMTEPLTDTQIINTQAIKLGLDRQVDYSKKSILIVDDNKLNIKVARRSVEPLGFGFIDECYNGQECLDKIQSGMKYDIILMDIMMPIMGGEKAIAKLQEDPEFNVPTIALTADAVSGSKEKYMDLGFVDYIAKPFSKQQIKEKLDKIFKNK